jgi:spore maturation protein CgeB
MRFVFFVHSLASDWNHGNAHFLRGVVRELLARGHDVSVYEPESGWSRSNLLREPDGAAALDEFERVFPELRPIVYGRGLDVRAAVAGADVVIVHEWNDETLVHALGELPRPASQLLLFHDTHHRSVTAPATLPIRALRSYDGVLAFGRRVRDVYLRERWTDGAWTWHEAADTRLFRPLDEPQTRDLVWIGNWGDDERSAELHEFLVEPARTLGLTGTVYGVRYPPEARRALERAGLEYGGWLPNHRAPQAFARHRVTVHVPRRPYAEALPGIPTIRPFEALACGIPLVSTPWDDAERLFRPGDYLVARDGEEMTARLGEALAGARGAGLETIRARHTCAHRADQLLGIVASVHEQRTAA